MTRYTFVNLTSAVSDKDSPLRQYLHAEFPNRKALGAQYRDSAGPLLADGGGAPPGTLGAAFDFLVRYTVDPNYSGEVTYAGFWPNAERIAAVKEVIEAAQAAARTEIIPDRRNLYRACWALALTTEVFRIGVWPDGAIDRLIQSRSLTKVGLMACASEQVLEELARLDEIAAERFYPHLANPESYALGPTFAASKLCAADADLIVQGRLIEVKTRLGAKNKRTGVRQDSLETNDLYQLVAYALFDTTNEFEIHGLGFYSGRYGTWMEWGLQEVLNELAGREVNVAAQRERVWQILGG